MNFHDSLCGPDPAYFAKLLGGAKKHGEVNYTLDAPVHYTVVDKANPIMKDMSDMTIFDEAFFNLTWAKIPPSMCWQRTASRQPAALATTGEVVPQIWTYEHTFEGGSRRGRLSGCRAIFMQISPTIRSSERCSEDRMGRPQAGGRASELCSRSASCPCEHPPAGNIW